MIMHQNVLTGLFSYAEFEFENQIAPNGGGACGLRSAKSKLQYFYPEIPSNVY